MRLTKGVLLLGAVCAAMTWATPVHERQNSERDSRAKQGLPVLAVNLVNATSTTAAKSSSTKAASSTPSAKTTSRTGSTAASSTRASSSSAAAPAPSNTGATLITYSSFLSDASAAQLRNPARGWIYQHDATLSDASTYFSGGDAGYAVQQGRAFIWLMLYLDQHADGSAISAAELAGIGGMLDAVRAAGLKTVLRFAYTADGSASITEPPLAGIKAHITQLAPVLSAGADVLFAVQQGFIGVWGEQYYTTHFGNEGQITAAQWADRSAVTTALLGAVPSPAFVQARTPEYKQRFLGSSTAVATSGNAFSNQSVARIGHFDDCFLADPTDLGTYRETSLTGPDHTYVAQDSLFVPRGGETCVPTDTSLLACPNALKLLAQESWVFLNIWNDEYTTTWKAGGCYDAIAGRLGYNLRMASVGVRAGGAGWTSLVLANTGFASVMLPYTVELLLVPTSGAGAGYKTTLPWDVRKIRGGQTLDLGAVALAAPAGSNITTPLQAVLNIRDSNAKIGSTPAFRIVLANSHTSAPAWAGPSRLNVLDSVQVTKLPSSGGSVALKATMYSVGGDGALFWT